jgi:hypothetical protein
MFGKKRPEKAPRGAGAHDAERRFQRNERAGKDIYDRIADLKNVPPDNLPDAVFMLFMEAKRQNELIRTSIKETAGYDFDRGGRVEGDLATYLAQEAVSALRDSETNPQTFLGVSSERSQFTISSQDAVSLLSATIREQRLDGILEGLRLAGLLNKASKRRHADPEVS